MLNKNNYLNISRTHIIPHHLKGVKYYNQNIKKILTYFKSIVFLVQYTIKIRLSLDFCEIGIEKKVIAPLLKKDFLIKGGDKHRTNILSVPPFCEVVKHYE